MGIAISPMVVSLSKLGFPMNVVKIYPWAILIENLNKHIKGVRDQFLKELGQVEKGNLKVATKNTARRRKKS